MGSPIKEGNRLWCILCIVHSILKNQPKNRFLNGATGLPVQYTYLGINGVLLILSLVILGWKFSVKTIYAVFVLTSILPIIQDLTGGESLIHDQPFMACVLGAFFCGGGIGVAFSANGSTGGLPSA